jgi:nitrite reductase/ring-hydroxylating ferredoxin subunit
MTKITRHDFLKISIQGLVAVSGLLGLGGLIRFLSYQPDPPPPARFDEGQASDYPPDSRTVLPDIPAVLICSKGNFSAYSLECTHLGCTVQVNSDMFTCPCHGSQYALDGKVLRHPARNPLQALKVEITSEGSLIVYKNRS